MFGKNKNVNVLRPIADSIDPDYIKANIKELEDEACKILSKANASRVIISKLDDIGCFVPIVYVDISKYISGSFCNSELFQVKVE